MLRLNPRVGLPLLVAVAVVALAAFAPASAATPVAQAGCAAGWWYGTPSSSTYTTCEWDFGCWINPFTPNGVTKNCTRTCTPKYDRYGFCGTDCTDSCQSNGVCC